jgi:hypothetical protein
VGNGGGIYAFGDLCAPTIVNCLISGNAASFGGAVWFGRTAGWTDNYPHVINCTITGNTTNGMDPIYDAGTIHIIRSYETSIGAKIMNSILWDNALPSGGAEIFSWLDPSWTDPIGKSIISYNDVEGASSESWFNNVTNGTGNVDTDPLFVDRDGPDDDVSTWADNDYHPGEPLCINTGDNASVPSDVSDLDGDGDTSEPTPFDLAHENRLSGIVDMGAYEVGDSDGDGIMNVDDNCPFTPNPLQEDDDGDDIGNVCDDCPNDPDNDADGDGICGDVDICPNDPDNDADSDGICGDVDICPNDPDNDADGDGVCGDLDGCPSDPGKTAPGQCGCGVADTDTDSDGTANCNDPDDDGDDLPDVWENTYGLDPLNATGDDGKYGDFDGDGYSNYDEFLAGTEPDDGNSLPLEVKEVIPHDGAGVAPDDMRIPNNTSFAVRILAPAGIDITEDMSIVFTVDDDVDDGTNTPYERNLGDPTVGVTKLDPNESDTAVTALWAVYHRSQEGAPDHVYDWENKVEIWVDATDTADVVMVQESYIFEVETQTEHYDAAATSPAATQVDPGDPDLNDPDYANPEGIEVTSGDLEGCKIIYESTEPVKPELGPSDEIPPFDNSGIDAVGVPMNLQPPTVFTNPVTIMIPCPGEPDVSILSVYMYNGTVWVEACDAAGNVLPGGKNWVVDGSRENDNTRTPPIIAIKVYHFTGVQAGAAIKAEDAAAPTTPGAATGLGGGGGGGGCFVETAGRGFKGISLFALAVGLLAAISVASARMKIRG